jgi:hypothetical protein
VNRGRENEKSAARRYPIEGAPIQAFVMTASGHQTTTRWRIGLLSFLVACKRMPAPIEAEPALSVPAHGADDSGAAVTAEVPGQAASATVARPAFGLVREVKQLEVDGKVETWRLEWEGPTQYDCFKWSRPCDGVIYGEAGPLRLVRAREGDPERVLSLGERSIQRWPHLDGDEQRISAVTPEAIAILEKRPIVPVMIFGDYDHDGRAAEFVLDRGWWLPVARKAILVGIDKAHPTPQVFGTVDAPDVPLTLGSREDWEKIRKASATDLARGVELVKERCGFLQRDTELTVLVTHRSDGFRATLREYACTQDGHRKGKFLNERRWAPDEEG